MRFRRLPLLFINDIDINSLYATLHTKHDLSSDRRLNGLFAFADPMLMFYNFLDGFVMTFPKRCRLRCKCPNFPVQSFPFVVGFYDQGSGDNLPNSFSFPSICNGCSSANVEIKIWQEYSEEQGDYVYKMSVVGWIVGDNNTIIYLSNDLTGLFFQWFGMNGKTINDYIPQIEQVYSLLQQAQSSGDYVLIKDRVLFDKVVVAETITKPTGSDYIILGKLILSTPTIEISERDIINAYRCVHKRPPSQEELEEIIEEIEDLGQIWCQNLEQILNSLVGDLIPYTWTQIGNNPAYRGLYSSSFLNIPFPTVFLESVLAYVFYGRKLQLIATGC